MIVVSVFIVQHNTTFEMCMVVQLWLCCVCVSGVCGDGNREAFRGQVDFHTKRNARGE